MLALLAAGSYGISDFAGGFAARKVAALRVVIVSYPVSIVAALLALPFLGGSVEPRALAWGAVTGLTGGLAVWWFYGALGSGPMSVVSPLTGVLAAGIPVSVGVISGERPGAFAYVGIALALVAVVLVSREPAAHPDGMRRPRFGRTVALLTFGSGVAFACGFMALHQVGRDAGMWPLVMSRVASTTVVWLVALTTRQFAAPRRGTLRLACVAGVMDVTASAAMMYAYHGGMLSLVTVIGALYPASTVLLATILLGERLAPAQWIGMVLALGAVALIAAA